jgi:hypothetical protein
MEHDSRTMKEFLVTGCDWFDGAPIPPLTGRET